MTESTQPESPPEAPRRELFSRARTPPPKRRWRLLAWTAIALLLFGAFKAIFAERIGLRAATPWGLTYLVPDMPREDVDRAFGGPLARESSTASGECLLYGQPAIRQEAFSIYRVCYRDGRISEFSERRFEGFGVDENGTLTVPPPDSAAP